MSSTGELFPQTVRLIGHDRRTTDLVNQQSADRERVVAKRFGLETISWPPCQQSIIGITIVNLWGGFGALLVGAAQHNQPLDVLQIPPGLNQFGSEPIEQLRV